MWSRRSHSLANLTILTYIKREFKWIQFKQYALDKVQRIMACDNLLTYLDFNEMFKVHTDASAFQSGAVIGQKCEPIAFYSRKLTHAQKWYTVIGREIISII